MFIKGEKKLNKNDNVFPILMQNGDKVIRLMELVYENDDSIYFIFPRKSGYKIDNVCVKKYTEGEYEERVLDLDKTDVVYNNPKISFHPRDMVVHVKSQFNEKLKDSYEIYNIAPENELFCYLVQVIFPLNFDIFDEYNKTKYKNILNINNNPNIDVSQMDFSNNNLNVEFFIHSNGILPDESCLPLCINRKCKYMATFCGNNLYSHTIVVSEMDANNKSNSIIITLNTKWEVIIIRLDAV